MEKGINTLIIDNLGLESNDIKSYSPLALAYIGDAIFDLVIRSKIIGKGNAPVNKMHNLATKYVSAKAQSFIVTELEDYFTEKEKDYYRRGKNTKVHTVAKNATLTEYRSATGFEAVLGYLYLTDQTERLFDIIKKAVGIIDER